MYSGPKVKRDGLIFGYDTGYGIADTSTSTRFYKGRPTQNYASPDLADWGTEGTSARIATGRKFRGQPTYNCRSQVGSVWIAIYETVSNLRTNAGSGGTVTVSVWCRNSTGTNRQISTYIGHDWSSNSYSTNHQTVVADGKWRHYTWTVDQSSMASDYVEFRPNTGVETEYIEMTMPQVEVNKDAKSTPFLNGTRSSTQSLIDLTKTRDIDVSNVSFDSDGLPTFDGTDDYINLPSSLATTLNGTTEASLNMIIKLDNQSNSANGSGIIQLSGYNNSNGNLYFYSNGYTYLDVFRTDRVSQVFANSTVTATEWHMLTITTTPGANGWKCYINGELKSQTTGQSTVSVDSTIQGGLTVGENSSGRFINGNIAAVKIYNRALSAAEIKQNFSAYRKRFNL